MYVRTCMLASISTDLSDCHVQYGCEFAHLQYLYEEQQYEEIHKKYKHTYNV